MTEQQLPEHYQRMKEEILQAQGKNCCSHCTKPLPKMRVCIKAQFPGDEGMEEIEYCSKECAIIELEEELTWLDTFYRNGKKAFTAALKEAREMKPP